MINFPVFPVANISETISFITEIKTSLNGTEVRRPVRAYPRLKYSQRYVFTSEFNTDLTSILLNRTNEVVLAPVGCHRLDTASYASLTTSGALNAAIADEFNKPVLGLATNYFVDGTIKTLDFTTLKNGAEVLPCIPCYLDAEYSIERVNGIDRMATLNLVSIGTFKEARTQVLTALDIKDPGLAPAFQHNWSTSAPSHRVAATNEILDKGNLEVVEHRYSKHTFNVSTTLINREEILAFRDFVYACKGSANAFYLKHSDASTSESTETPGYLARLATDDITIEYLQPNLAKCSFDVVLVEQ